MSVSLSLENSKENKDFYFVKFVKLTICISWKGLTSFDLHLVTSKEM